MAIKTVCDWKGCDTETKKSSVDNDFVELRSIMGKNSADLCPVHFAELNTKLDVKLDGGK